MAEKKRIRLAQSQDAQDALRRMLTQGAKAKAIVDAMLKNFGVKLYPSQLAGYRRKWGLETPQMLKRDGKKVAAAQSALPLRVTDAPLPTPIVPPQGKAGITELVRLLQVEIKRVGLAAVRVPATGNPEIELA